MAVVVCTWCKKSFEKRDSQIRKSPNHFCSRTCAAIRNNQIYPKRMTIVRTCLKCKKELPGRRKKCDDCLYINWDTITLGELTDDNYQRFARVRQHARAVYKKSGRPECCMECGYERHYEVCHIKDIAKFELSTPISVINDINNLLAFCPTHHWEFDHGYLNHFRPADEIRTHMNSISLSPR